MLRQDPEAPQKHDVRNDNFHRYIIVTVNYVNVMHMLVQISGQSKCLLTSKLSHWEPSIIDYRYYIS